jgi:hypothetical protein
MESMPRDYAQSAVRHYQDGELLADASRFCGAGHFVGLAVECALKHAARNYTTPKGKEIDGHLPTLKRTIRTLIEGRSGRLFSLVRERNFFDDWHINDRYEADGYVTREQYETWKSYAIRTLSLANLMSGAKPDAPKS